MSDSERAAADKNESGEETRNDLAELRGMAPAETPNEELEAKKAARAAAAADTEKDLNALYKDLGIERPKNGE